MSKDFKDGKVSPSNLNSPYGLSSTTGISYLFIISINLRRLSNGQVLPDGFWKSGITYINFTLLFEAKTFSNSSIFIPSLSVAISINSGSYAFIAFSAPIYDGLSHKTTSPLSKNVFPEKSKPCWEPLVINISSGLTLVLSVLFILCAIFSLNGRYPSVVVYCNATFPCSSNTATDTFFISSTGNNSGAGIPPAKDITSGLAVSFNNSRIAEPSTFPILSANLTAMLKHPLYIT